MNKILPVVFRPAIHFVCHPLIFLLLFHFTNGISAGQDASVIQWKTDIEQATVLAGQQNKLVLLHFTADWCHPCRTLETFVFSNPKVQRSMAANVIAVKVDVDEFPNLVKEYGVAGVPFDVAITPAGRVVAKRSSPRDALAYNEMIQGFNKTIQGLDGGNNKALLQNLDELKDKMYSDNQIVERKPLAPLAPSHRGPQPSFDSQELKRNSKIANPFVAASADAALVNSEPEASSKAASAEQSRQHNSFVKTALAPGAPAATTKVETKVEPKIVLNDRFFKDEVPNVAAAASKTESASKTDFAIKNTNEFTPPTTPKAEVATPASHPEPSVAVVKLLAENPELALHGKCPVTLLKESRWADGDPNIGCVHRQRTYLFSTAECLREFQQDPDAYSPLLAGYDPVIFERSGELVAGEESHGVFMGRAPHQRVVLFSNSETRTEFQANPHKYIETIRQAMQSSGGSSSTLLR